MLGENGMEAVQGESEDAEGKSDTSLINEVEPEKDASVMDETESGEIPCDPAAYCSQRPWKRILISLAGPAMNVILGFLMMSVIVLMAGIDNAGTNTVWGFHVTYASETELSGIREGDYLIGVDGKRLTSFAELSETVKNSETHTFDLVLERLSEDGKEIERVTLEDVTLLEEHLSLFKTSLSETSGLCVGDEVIAVNSTPTYIANDLQYELMMQGYKPLNLTVLRNGERVELEGVVIPNAEQDGAVIGVIDFIVVREEALDFVTVMKHTWCRSVSTVKTVFDSLFGLFSGRFGVESISGPVGITKTIGEVARDYGFVNLLYLVVVISINLGVMNLLPLPALDGGHILLHTVEWVRGKPLKREIEAMINFVGLVLLLGLAVIIAFKDVFTLL
jgi:regulator of sigma E protease